MRKKTSIIPLAFFSIARYNIYDKHLSGKRNLTVKGKYERLAVRRRISPLLPFWNEGVFMEEKRLAVLSVMAEDRAMAEKINAYLSEFGEFIVGRMGIPYRERGVFVMCVVLDAPASSINALTGKIGSLNGVSAKTLFGKI